MVNGDSRPVCAIRSCNESVADYCSDFLISPSLKMSLSVKVGSYLNFEFRAPRITSNGSGQKKSVFGASHLPDF